MTVTRHDIVLAGLLGNIGTFDSLLARISLGQGDAEYCAERLLRMAGRNTDKMARSLFKAFNVQLWRGRMASIIRSWAEEATGLDDEVNININRTVLTLFVS